MEIGKIEDGGEEKNISSREAGEDEVWIYFPFDEKLFTLFPPRFLACLMKICYLDSLFDARSKCC